MRAFAMRRVPTQRRAPTQRRVSRRAPGWPQAHWTLWPRRTWDARQPTAKRRDMRRHPPARAPVPAPPQRADGPHARVWRLPGGYVSWMEDPIAAVVRGVKEETHLVIDMKVGRGRPASLALGSAHAAARARARRRPCPPGRRHGAPSRPQLRGPSHPVNPETRPGARPQKPPEFAALRGSPKRDPGAYSLSASYVAKVEEASLKQLPVRARGAGASRRAAAAGARARVCTSGAGQARRQSARQSGPPPPQQPRQHAV